MDCREGSYSVGHVYGTTFHMVGHDGYVVHFSNASLLPSPFTVITDRSIDQFMPGLEKGEVFIRDGCLLRRQTSDRFNILFSPDAVVDLGRKISKAPPSNDELKKTIHGLATVIAGKGNFDGIAGVLQSMPGTFPGFPAGMIFPHGNLWSETAVPIVRELVQSSIGRDLTVFEKSYRSLVGLGPGLTPSGDDLLVGFLAAHKLFSSSFACQLDNVSFKRRLTCANVRTTAVAAQFLSAAMDGIFSETLFEVLRSAFDATRHGIHADGGDQECGGDGSFLNWGHSSGTDTLAGALLGFWTMLGH